LHRRQPEVELVKRRYQKVKADTDYPPLTRTVCCSNLATREAIISVILSSQRVALTEALYTASRKDSKPRLPVPSSSTDRNSFPRSPGSSAKQRHCTFTCGATTRATPPVNALLTYATFYLDGRKAFETTAIEIVDATPNRLRTMPLRFSVPLDKLAEGGYTFQVPVLDFNGKDAVFWQAPIMEVR
jgi:hypothetical protein